MVCQVFVLIHLLKRVVGTCHFSPLFLPLHHESHPTLFVYYSSPHYASPEVVQGITYDGEKADIWSCGVILYALVSGKLPFDNENIRVLLGKVKSGVYTMPPFLHKDVQDLISRMLVVDPAKRISMDEIRSHPWYTSRDVRTEETKRIEKVGTVMPFPVLWLTVYSLCLGLQSDVVADLEQVDEDIIRSLIAFGFGDEDSIKQQITSSEYVEEEFSLP